MVSTLEMVAQKTFATLLLSAGLAAAIPAHHGRKQPWIYSGFSGHAVMPSGTGLLPVGTGAPIFATGTVAPCPTGSVYAVNVKKSTKGSKSSSKSTNSTSTASGISYKSRATESTSNSTSIKAITPTADEGCTFTVAATAASSKASCSNIVLKDITVPAGETLDLTDLNDGTTVTFEGTTTFEYEEWKGPLISFSGTNITITGASGHLIDGNGAKWWDGEGSNGDKTKPKFFYAHKLIDSVIFDLNIKNWPVQCMSVNGAQNLSIKNLIMDDSAGDELNSDGDTLGHNTDAFDVGSSTGVYISGVTVKNQDDCLAINSGSDISFTGGSCSGGHGLSIGSVGGRTENDVSNVYIADSTISDSQNGVRIKTVYDATGSVNNITYSGITLANITKYGIVIEQDYENGSPTGTPTDGVPITDITIRDVTGTVGDKGTEVFILCASCNDWTWSGVSITGGEASTECEGVPDGVFC